MEPNITVNVSDGGVVNMAPKFSPRDMFDAAQRDKVNKSLSDDEASIQLIKSSEASRYTLGLAYPAMRPDVGTGMDGYQDFVSADRLEKAAWSWLRKTGGTIGVGHADGTEGRGTVVESYVYRGPDWQVGNSVIKAGDWLVGTIWDEQTWPLIKTGMLNGYSPQGTATRSVPSEERIAQLRSK